jgi:hypothetical protein
MVRRVHRLERVHQELEKMSAADRVEVSRLREKIEEVGPRPADDTTAW